MENLQKMKTAKTALHGSIFILLLLMTLISVIDWNFISGKHHFGVIMIVIDMGYFGWLTIAGPTQRLKFLGSWVLLIMFIAMVFAMAVNKA